MFRFVGIDPGKSGAIAIINEGNIEAVENFDLDLYRKLLIEKIVHLDRNQYKVFIEDVHAMPGQGVTSMFHFGENFGQICGLLTGLGIQYEKVIPSKWKKVLGVTSDKQTSIDKANELYFEPPLFRTIRSRVPDNNRAESILIAEYAKIQFDIEQRRQSNDS